MEFVIFDKADCSKRLIKAAGEYLLLKKSKLYLLFY
jgi:hypothetical protein